MMDAAPGPPPGRPRWVNVLAIVAVVVALVIVIAILSGGEHGPGRHAPDNPGNHTPPVEHSR